MQLLINIILSLIAEIVIIIFSFITGYNYHKVKMRQQIDTAIATAKSKYPTIRPVPEFNQIINNIRYSTLDAKCIAQGASLIGGWTWLMQTNNNRFFFLISWFLHLQIAPLTKEEAIKAFTEAACREAKFEDVFPDVEIKNA